MSGSGTLCAETGPLTLFLGGLRMRVVLNGGMYGAIRSDIEVGDT